MEGSSIYNHLFEYTSYTISLTVTLIPNWMHAISVDMQDHISNWTK